MQHCRTIRLCCCSSLTLNLVLLASGFAGATSVRMGFKSRVQTNLAEPTENGPHRPHSGRMGQEPVGKMDRFGRIW